MPLRICPLPPTQGAASRKRPADDGVACTSGFKERKTQGRATDEVARGGQGDFVASGSGGRVKCTAKWCGGCTGSVLQICKAECPAGKKQPVCKKCCSVWQKRGGKECVAAHKAQ